MSAQWRDKSFFYCLAVLKKKTTIRGTKRALHESALPIYSYIEKYLSNYGRYPSAKHVCTKFNIKSSKYYEEGWTITSLSDYIKDERVKFDVQETQTTLQKLTIDGNDHTLDEYMAPMQKLFDGLVKMETKRITKLSQSKSIINKFMTSTDKRVAKFGFKQLDKVTGGINRGNYIILFANTNEGKSTFSRCIAGNIALQGRKVLYITLEESGEESVVKTATVLSQVNANDVFDKKLQGDKEERLKRFRLKLKKSGGDVFYVDRMDGGVAELQTLINDLAPDVIVVDQLSHLLPDGDYDWKVVNKVSKQLQQITQRTKIPIICLHQSTRESKKGAKQEAAWGYGIIQDADLVMYLCPDEEMENGDIRKRVVIPKARSRKKNVCIDFLWNLDRGVVAEMLEVHSGTVFTKDGEAAYAA